MPVDVFAEVIANAHLSDDYSVLALVAPEIASRAAPGQFVMIKPSAGIEPLLRRPFSIFEILRDAAGTPTGLSILNKRVGVGTALLYSARPGEHLACLGPLGKPFNPVSPPAEAWMVAGGVGLAPFATLAESLVRRGTSATLFYGARRGTELFCTDVFERLGVQLALATEDGSRGDTGVVTVPLERALAARSGGGDVHLYACGPTPMMRAVAGLAARHGRPCDVSLEQVMGCGMGGCYSCVVRVRSAAGELHFVRSCLAGPVFDSRDLAWEELGAGH
jgi:dihydroorotate dehydrogenase electron transfer subunit